VQPELVGLCSKSYRSRRPRRAPSRRSFPAATAITERRAWLSLGRIEQQTKTGSATSFRNSARQVQRVR
jgi:hypothetical protein